MRVFQLLEDRRLSHINSTNDINLDYKVLTALGMSFVLCGHFGSATLTMGGLFQYDTFHIPLFIFISGYFFKDKYIENGSSLFKFLVRKIKHLLIPYYMWNSFYLLFAYVLQQHSSFAIYHGKISLKQFLIVPLQLSSGAEYNVASWFLVALFLCHVLFSIIAFVFYKNGSYILELALFPVFLLISIASLYVSCSNWHSEWRITLCRTGYLVFYYYLGYAYKRYFERIDQGNNVVITILMPIIIKALLIYKYGNHIFICYNMTYDETIPQIYYFVGAIAGIYFWLHIAKLLSVTMGDNKLVLYYANHTFSLMMHQGIVGVAINGLIIFVFKKYDLLGDYYSRIWFNVLHGEAAVLVPIAISLVILTALKVCELLCRNVHKYVKQVGRK